MPENPRRAYDVRKVVEGLADVGTVMELRPRWGRCVSTSLIRLGGQAVGVIANNPTFGAGAIDRDGSDKISRHIELCNAFDLPMLFLCDTPGFMIGPGAEQTALVRHSARTLMALANADVPVMSIILRKAYGLGYYVMGSDAFEPDLLLGWPTAEFGGMGLEGAVNIVYPGGDRGRRRRGDPQGDPGPAYGGAQGAQHRARLRPGLRPRRRRRPRRDP